MSTVIPPSSLPAPFSPGIQRLASSLKKLRRKHKVSLNALSKLSGISRRTLARIESGHGPRVAGRSSPVARHGSRVAGHGPRTLMRLLRLLLRPDRVDAILRDATRLSRAYARDAGGTPDDYALLDLLPDPYPYFLFHPPQNELDNFIRQEFGPDYRDSLHRLVVRPPGNLGLRLRAFRLQHDFTLVQTADFLGLSKSELHRIERAERHPSAQTAYRILRLLTLPALPGHHNLAARLKQGEAASQPAWAGTSLSQATGRGSRATAHDPLDSLRHLWLSGRFKTRDLAARLGISQPHLIRLLRGHRHPSKKLLQRISSLLAVQ